MLLATLGFVAGAAAGAGTVPEGSGLAGGATVFVYGVGGLFLGIVGAIVLVMRLPPARFRLAFLVAAALAVLAAVWVGLRLASQQAAVLWPDGIVHAASSQRYPALSPSERPLGLGIAHVTSAPGGVLQFYRRPRASVRSPRRGAAGTVRPRDVERR